MKTTIATVERCGLARSGLFAAAAVALIVLAVSKAVPQAATSGAPETLQDTGLYSDFAALQVDDTHLAFSPQYPLWTDGAAKRRWISLPPGTAIDASDPDAWSFPVGTRLWKEFSFAGQRVETRFMERRPDGWLYAAYAWSADGRETQRVSARGRRGAYPLEGGRSHAIPGVTDCKVCHQGGRSEVLGFSAIQLSPQRDPDALHADASSGIDLDALVRTRSACGAAGIAARRAADRRSIGTRTHGARLPARQLRALSQRARPIAQRRALPAPDRRSHGAKAPSRARSIIRSGNRRPDNRTTRPCASSRSIRIAAR